MLCFAFKHPFIITKLHSLAVLGYVLKSSPAHPQRNRGKIRWGNPNNILPQLLPDPPQESNQAIKGSFPHAQEEHREAVASVQAREHQLHAYRITESVPAPPRAVPGEQSAPLSCCKTHQNERTGATFWSTFEGVLPRGMGHIIRCTGRAFGACIRLIMGCSGEEPEAGKGMDLGDMGR